MVTFKTSMGDIKLELFEEEAPLSVKNFLDYANSGHYDGTVFHRVIDNFMIQGGGFDQNFSQKPTRNPIQNEANNGLKNERGTVAMARTMDIHSATSQFFINVVDNDFLDYQDDTPQGFGYCVFAKVTEGMDIIDKIKGVETSRKGHHEDVPVDDIVIKETIID